MAARRIQVTGNVQGVFFRAHTKEKAVELGLRGWVRNTSDGGVEIHAEGEEDKLQKLEEWCWKGPERADVEFVDAREAPEEGCTGFEIRL